MSMFSIVCLQCARAQSSFVKLGAHGTFLQSLLYQASKFTLLQDNLDDASKENRQLTDELEQLESENTELHSASHERDRVTAELSDFQQQARDMYDSLSTQSQQEVDALNSNARQLQRQLQSSYAQVQTLQDQLERAQNYIQALQNQFGAGPDGRAPPGQGMRLPRPVRTSSLTGSLRSPRSPGGSSTSSTTSSRRNSDFQVKFMLKSFTLGYWLLGLAIVAAATAQPCCLVFRQS